MAVDDQYTKSLLHFDGNLNDESGKTWTAYGGAATSTTQKKFGGSSLYLDGADDYIGCTHSDFNMGADDFTYELQCYIPSLVSGTKFIVSNGYDSNGSMGLYNDETLLLSLKNDSGSWVVNNGSCGSAPISKWFHLMIARYGVNIYVGIDGTLTLSRTISASDSFSCNKIEIGYASTRALGSSFCNLYADELRISKGIARWTTNFTPPTYAYGQTPPSSRKILIPASIHSASAHHGW